MTKLPYERPSIVRHELGALNKFGRAGARVLDRIDGVPVAELVERYGSPLFVFSERTIRERVRDLDEAVTLRYPGFRIAWSYKTNYLDAICRVFHQEGAWAEVVSAFEYEKAVRNGVPPSEIIFNGPWKPDDALRRALADGAHVNLDHFDEMLQAERIARELGRETQVGLRLNMTAGLAPHWARFGFNLDNGQARAAVRHLHADGALRLTGLHCHLGTFILDVGAYREAARKLALFALRLREEFGIEIESIDLGGGFASPNTLRAQYLPGEQVSPSFRQYAEAIADGLEELGGTPPLLVLENGRALVDEAGYLIATVLANKRLPGGQRGIVVDAGVNTLFTSFWYKHDVVPAQPSRGTPEPASIYGPLCMNIDVLREHLLFPQVRPGERLVFRNVGAYNVTQWMQFITYRPNVVLISPNGEHAPIRRAESLETLVAQESVPDWLG